MKVAAVLFALMAAGVQGRQTFLQAKGEPVESVTAGTQVPIVESQFQLNGMMTVMQCVISLTIQFMIVYTALAICRMAADSYGLKYDNLPIQKILQTATLTVNFAPMLAILFLACWMRVTQLTKGKGNPPEWVQLCMYFCTYSVLVMTLCICVIPLFTGEVINVDPKTGDIPDDAKPFESQAGAISFTVLKYLILLSYYGGALAVVYGVITYVPPAGIWPEGKQFPVAPAVQCTMILACQYFIVYGLIQVAHTWTQFNGMKMTKFEHAMMTATASMNFAPMLAVLFIAARMRALSMDPIDGNSQKWAQNSFFMCTYALLAQTCFSVVVPLVLQGEVKVGKVEGDMDYVVENKLLGAVLAVGRYVMMICLYIGAGCVIYSIFVIQHPKGPAYTIPISVTMQCVVNLTFQFFFVYTWIWAAITIKEFTGLQWTLMTQTMENCKGVVMFCPMLAILFLGTQMRALLLTNNRGAPQGWCQDGMYMATWSLLIQFVMVLVTPCATGVPAHCDEDGNIRWEPENKILFYCVVVVRFLGFFLLYGGIITVIIAVYTMTPETANGYGAVPLVGDGKVPGTDNGVPGYEGIKEPYGANDILGMGAEMKGKAVQDAGLGLFLLLLLGFLLLLLLPLFPSFSSMPSSSDGGGNEGPDLVEGGEAGKGGEDGEGGKGRDGGKRGITEVERAKNPSIPKPKSIPGSPASGCQSTSETFSSDDHVAVGIVSMSALAEFPFPTGVVSSRSLSASAVDWTLEFGSVFSQVMPFLDDRTQSVVRQVCRHSTITSSSSDASSQSSSRHPKRVTITSSSSDASSHSSRRHGITASKSVQPLTIGPSASTPKSAHPRPRQFYLMDLDLLIHSGLWKDQNNNFWKVEECSGNHRYGDIRRYKSEASFKAGGSLRQAAIHVQDDGALFWEMRGRPGYGWVLEYTGYLARAQTLTWKAIPSGNKFLWTRASFSSTDAIPDGIGVGKNSVSSHSTLDPRAPEFVMPAADNEKGKGKGKRSRDAPTRQDQEDTGRPKKRRAK